MLHFMDLFYANRTLLKLDNNDLRKTKMSCDFGFKRKRVLILEITKLKEIVISNEINIKLIMNNIFSSTILFS